MSNMFAFNNSFNQNISMWNVANLTTIPTLPVSTSFSSTLSTANMPPSFRPAPTITNFSNITKTFVDEPFTLNPTSNSIGAFSYTSSDTNIASISGNIVTLTGTLGSTTITATQAYSDDFSSLVVTATLTVTLVPPTLSDFELGELRPFSDIGQTIPLTNPTSNSPITSFTFSSSDTNVATIFENTITIVGAGETIITVTQASGGKNSEYSDPNREYYGVGTITDSLIIYEIELASNNVTYRTVRSSFPAGSSNPRFAFDENGEVYALMSSSLNSRDIIKAYADGSNTTPFNRNGTLIPFNRIITTLMTTMADMLDYYSGRFNQPIESWDTSNVTNMSRLFSENGRFNQPLNSWNISKVTNMTYMFHQSGFNQPLDSWNTSNVTTMDHMFSYCDFNYPIGNWDTSNVTNMHSMFAVTNLFNQDISSWNVSKVTDLSSMFTFSVFNQPIDIWNTANVTTMNSMFRSNLHFNQPIGSWNTANVSNMTMMFYGATKFNQDISGWNITKVTPKPPTLFQDVSSLTTVNIPPEFRPAPTITNFSNVTKTFSDVSFSLSNPTSNSTGAFSFQSSNSAIASILGNTVTIKGTGTVTITATQAFDNNYRSASVTATLTINTGVRTTTISGISNMSKTFGDEAFYVNPTSNSPASFTYQSSNTSVATISGNMITVVGAGSATITVSQEAFSNATTSYAAGSVTATLTVNKANPILSDFSVPSSKTFGDTFELTAPTSNSTEGSFSYTSSDTDIATISENAAVFTIVFIGAGSVTITATQAESANYNSASITSATITIGKATPILSAFSVDDVTLGDASFQLPSITSSNTETEITYQSSNTSVATVSGNTVTIAGIGSATITANQAVSGNYEAGSISATFKVHEIKAISNADSTTTYKTMRSSFPSGSVNPYFATDINGTFYAVMDNSQDSIDKIRAYANNQSSTPFSHNDTLIPFNRIVTTFMTDMNSMFASINFQPIRLFNQDISSWDTSNVTNMSYMFFSTPQGAPHEFNKNIGSWNTAKVTNMTQMFRRCNKFNQPIGSWNTASVTDMTEMFRESVFNQPIGSWNTANVTSMSFMFSESVFNQPLGLWNVAKVTRMDYMFDASPFNQSIDSWDTANVLQMQAMFNNNIKFNQPLNSWNTNKVQYMFQMFSGATKLNQPLSNWNTANVTHMDYMFYNATIFNQNISGWDVTKVTPVPPSGFRDNSALVTANIPVAFRPAPTITNFYTSGITKTVVDESLTLIDPTSNSTGAFSYTSSDTNVAEISGNVVTIKGVVGSATITATQAASDDFKSGSATATLNVTLVSPTITFSISSRTFELEIHHLNCNPHQIVQAGSHLLLITPPSPKFQETCSRLRVPDLQT